MGGIDFGFYLFLQLLSSLFSFSCAESLFFESAIPVPDPRLRAGFEEVQVARADNFCIEFQKPQKFLVGLR